MRRPAYQHYPADWRNNTNLRRCSWAARGVWVDILGFMHDSDEYGILRWKLSEVGKAVGCPMGLVRELVFYGVLKGSDLMLDKPYIYTPISGRKRGPDVTLVGVQPGPIWFSSRMVRDEHIRIIKGYGRPADDVPLPSPEPPPSASPDHSPMPPIGEDIKGDTNAPQSEGFSISSSSSSSLRSDKKRSRKRDAPVPMPPDFQISDRVRRWASSKGFDRLDERFEWFIGYVRANGRWYVDWDDAFMNSIRGDWAKLANGERRQANGGSPSSLAERRARNMDILTGKVVPNGGVVIEGVARTVDQPPVLPLPGDLREPDGDDVGGCGPKRSASGLG